MVAPFSNAILRQFTTRTAVAGSSRALGWDTMLPTSSCGTRMSTAAFGHVGFTGTSLWIDPVRDRYFVLLTNRACGGGSLDHRNRLETGMCERPAPRPMPVTTSVKDERQALRPTDEL